MLKCQAPIQQGNRKGELCGKETKNKYCDKHKQNEIINSIRDNKNVIADCVAGSGKTTTVLFLAHYFPDKNIIQITYNAELKMEVRKKVKTNKLNNLEIHTYHSLGVKYYNKNAYNTALLNKINVTNRAFCLLWHIQNAKMSSANTTR